MHVYGGYDVNIYGDTVYMFSKKTQKIVDSHKHVLYSGKIIQLYMTI